MRTKDLVKLFAKNIEQMIEAHDLKSNREVQDRTSVSKGQVYNVRKEYNAATLRSVARFSEGFGVPPWSLLHPNGLDIYKDPRLATLIDAYSKASEDAKGVILSVAETQSRYSSS